MPQGMLYQLTCDLNTSTSPGIGNYQATKEYISKKHTKQIAILPIISPANAHIPHVLYIFVLGLSRGVD